MLTAVKISVLIQTYSRSSQIMNKKSSKNLHIRFVCRFFLHFQNKIAVKPLFLLSFANYVKSVTNKIQSGIKISRNG